MGGIKGRKAAARLERRRAAWAAIPHNNSAQNPGKQSGGGHKMHKPGSRKR